MADVASDIDSWSGTAASNSPAGGTAIGTGLDDNLRQIQATVRKYLRTVGTNVASASALDLSSLDGSYVSVTGTTAITSISSKTAGYEVWLVFAGALTLTHNAASLILPGGANITTAAGDIAKMVSLGSGNWKCAAYVALDGNPISISDHLAAANTWTGNQTFNGTQTFNGNSTHAGELAVTGNITSNGTITLNGGVTGGDQTVTAINLKDYGEVNSAAGNITGATTFNVNNGNVHSGTVTGNFTATFSNPTASDEACSMTILLTNGSAGTPTWPGAVDWGDSGAPTLQSFDIVEFVTIDGGTTWYGMHSFTKA